MGGKLHIYIYIYIYIFRLYKKSYHSVTRKQLVEYVQKI